MSKLLVIDSDAAAAEALQQALKCEGHAVRILTDSNDLTEGEELDAIILDVYSRGKGRTLAKASKGLELVEVLNKLRPDVPVIVMSSVSEGNIEATLRGAYACIPKPTTEQGIRELLVTIRRAANHRKCNSEGLPSTDEIVNGIVGESPAMRHVFTRIGQVARTGQTVLIVGETGTGKELVARSIHMNSDRRDKPLVVVDCAALSETLVESEFFGHVKGAFTGATTERRGKFEEANGGTIFLEEIGELSPRLQQKLLRLLDNRTLQPVGSNKTVHLNVRIIAATNRDLKKAAEKKEFREDLYHRLRGTRIDLPPLRERREDIPALISYFMEKDRPAAGNAHPSISREAVEFLQGQWWTGNIRELRNVVEDALSRANGFGITMDILREIFSIDDTKRNPDGRLIDPAIAKKAVDEPGRLPAEQGHELLPLGELSDLNPESLQAFVGSLLDKAERGEITKVWESALELVGWLMAKEALRRTKQRVKAAALLGICYATLVKAFRVTPKL